MFSKFVAQMTIPYVPGLGIIEIKTSRQNFDNGKALCPEGTAPFAAESPDHYENVKKHIEDNFCEYFHLNITVTYRNKQ